MLCLLLNLGSSAFALPCSRLIRIVPLAPLRPLPSAPQHFAGLLHYRGAGVPVIDLCALMLSRPAARLLSSRIVLIDYDKTEGQLLGLLAERVMETISLDEKTLRPPAVQLDGAPYLGRVASTDRGLIQLIEPEQLLPKAVKSQLFPAAISL